jgi:hypothetical protein
MTNDEIRMSKEARMPKHKCPSARRTKSAEPFDIRASSLIRHWCFVIRHFIPLAPCCLAALLASAAYVLPNRGQEPVRPLKSSPARFVNVARLAGIDFTHYNDPKPGRFFLPEIMGGGAAWLDLDGDGWLDLFLVNGCVLPHDPQDRDHLSALYRNHGDGHFTEVGESAGADHNGYGQGVTAADFDNDGFDDLVVTTFGQVSYYRNNGDGTFRVAAAGGGLDAGGSRWYLSAAPGDLDRDGPIGQLGNGNAAGDGAGHDRAHALGLRGAGDDRAPEPPDGADRADGDRLAGKLVLVAA